MGSRAKDKRLYVRFPFRTRVSYKVMGDDLHLPNMFPEQTETVDLSKRGLRICLEGRAVDVGSMLVVRVPISEIRTTVPVLAEVRWVSKNEHGACHAGLQFIP